MLIYLNFFKNKLYSAKGHRKNIAVLDVVSAFHNFCQS